MTLKQKLVIAGVVVLVALLTWVGAATRKPKQTTGIVQWEPQNRWRR